MHLPTIFSHQTYAKEYARVPPRKRVSVDDPTNTPKRTKEPPSLQSDGGPEQEDLQSGPRWTLDIQMGRKSVKLKTGRTLPTVCTVRSSLVPVASLS